MGVPSWFGFQMDAQERSRLEKSRTLLISSSSRSSGQRQESVEKHKQAFSRESEGPQTNPLRACFTRSGLMNTDLTCKHTMSTFETNFKTSLQVEVNKRVYRMCAWVLQSGSTAASATVSPPGLRTEGLQELPSEPPVPEEQNTRSSTFMHVRTV